MSASVGSALWNSTPLHVPSKLQREAMLLKSCPVLLNPPGCPKIYMASERTRGGPIPLGSGEQQSAGASRGGHSRILGNGMKEAAGCPMSMEGLATVYAWWSSWVSRPPPFPEVEAEERMPARQAPRFMPARRSDSCEGNLAKPSVALHMCASVASRGVHDVQSPLSRPIHDLVVHPVVSGRL